METFLASKHRSLNAKMVDFAGWQMPLNYQSVLQEHAWVRAHAGIFDISHMGRIAVSGSQSEAFINAIITSDLLKLKDGMALYTVFCNEQGMSLDDVLVYRQTKDSFFIVVNASNRAKDLEHLRVCAKNFDVHIDVKYNHEGILAVQGPTSDLVLKEIWPEVGQLKKMHHIQVNFEHTHLIIAQTGYTGELGYEIYGTYDTLAQVWDSCIKHAEVKPIGLAARDMLRLEMGYALYGHELSESISPLESVARWTISWNKNDFVGKGALLELKENKKLRHAYGIMLAENAIAREGCRVLKDDKDCGCVTSGAFSPSLKRSIALIIADRVLQIGDEVQVSVRNRIILAEVVKLPFLKK